MALLFECVKTFFLEQGLDKIYWVAYSGGVDSHVLLHLCAELRKQYFFQLRAVYVDHGLSVHAPAWGAHCATVCHDLRIEFIQKKIAAAPAVGESPEEAARQCRYTALAELLTPAAILLTAHQQDDQAETLLVQLLRGAGPKGLAAMPSLKVFAQGFQGRPLLAVSRAALTKYALANRLQWVEDESNRDIHFTRNFLRHEILPVLQQRWPTVTKTLARVAIHCAEAQMLLDNVTSQDLARCRTDKKNTLAIQALLLLDAIRQRQVLRMWLAELKFPALATVKLQQIQQDFLHASPDKLPHMRWGGVELRRYQHELYALRPFPPSGITPVMAWDFQGPLLLPAIGSLQAVLTQGSGLRLAIKEVTVGFRQGGERCYLRGSHSTLKKLLQEWGIPPWLRKRLPLIYFQETLVAVVGFFLDTRYAASGSEEGHVIALVSLVH
jgi:tRNA(Ile)-lysidine synthase